MADVRFPMPAGYPSPPNHLSPRQYSYLPSTAADPRHKPSTLATLPPHYNNVRAVPGALSMSPSDIKPVFGGVGTAMAYGGPHLPDMPVPETNSSALLGELVFTKPSAEKKLTRDGQPAKRRGPKPDSKPAMTRRQELNRQAQRTHRERKELYIKDLENQVLRLREVFTTVSQDKERLATENYSLKLLLHQNGLPTPTGLMDDSMSSASGGPYMGNSPISNSNSYGLPSATTSQHTPYTPSALSATGTIPQGLSPPGGLSPGKPSPGHQASRFRIPPQTIQSASSASQPQRSTEIDYEQNGINFVLQLEQPCMEHLPWLLDRSSANDGLDPTGHALMASCPPQPFSELTPNTPFGPKFTNNATANHSHAQQHQQQAPSSSKLLSPGPSVPARNFSKHSPAASHPTAESQACVPSTVAEVDGAAPPLRTWEVSKGDLNTLLGLSQKLPKPKGSEVTPIEAWGMVMRHPRLRELSEADLTEVSDVLKPRIRCYGFGAVLEDFEVQDALEAIVATKPETLAIRCT